MTKNNELPNQQGLDAPLVGCMCFDDKNPPHMTRLLILWEAGQFDFAYYKDGMYLVNDEWYHSTHVKAWITIQDLRSVLNVS